MNKGHVTLLRIVAIPVLAVTAFTLLQAGERPFSEGRELRMGRTTLTGHSPETRPAIDLRSPARTETASFALG